MVNKPLQGIRVVDLSRVFAMPYAGAYLADMGAEVIKIATHHSQFIDTTRTLNGPYPENQPGDNYWERGGTFQTLNRGKRSLTLDLRVPDSISIIKDLIQISDIFLENFTPRVLARFGLDYPTLKNIKPDLIMVSNTGYGHNGPFSNFGAMATALEPTHGTGAFTGYRDSTYDGHSIEGTVPNKIANSYTDFLASWTAQLAILGSLIHRTKTGQGSWVDLAMYQVGTSFMGEGLLDYTFNQTRSRRIGNRHEYFAPHGCFPCKGKDEWVVLAIRNNDEWKSFCSLLGKDNLAQDNRFKDPVSRHSHQDDLDPFIKEWTRQYKQTRVMEILQNNGIPCGAVLNALGMLSDPNFRARGFFESVEHTPETGLGKREYVSRGWHLESSDVTIRGQAPQMGEANDYVLRDMLGLGESDISYLDEKEAIGKQLAGASIPSMVPLRRQEELGWVAGYDPDYKEKLDLDH